MFGLTLSAFLAPPFSGLDTLPSLGVVVIGLIIMGIMAFRPQGLFGKKEELHLDA